MNVFGRRQVSRMSTEGEAAPAAEAPAEGEPLPEVIIIAIVIIIVIIVIIIVVIIVIIISSDRHLLLQFIILIAGGEQSAPSMHGPH